MFDVIAFLMAVIIVKANSINRFQITPVKNNFLIAHITGN